MPLSLQINHQNTEQLRAMKLKLFDTIRIPFLLVSIFWLIELGELAWGDISFLGVAPRSLKGVAGIFFMPFLHGGFGHLFSNTPSFIILCGSIIYFYPKIAGKFLLYSYLLTGMGVWLFARAETSYHGFAVHHIGASGVIYAYAAFLFFSGVFRREVKSLSISLAVAVLYSGMLQGIVPNAPGVSWESHLIGATIGTALAYHFRLASSQLSDAQLEAEKQNPEPEFNSDSGYQPLENEWMRYEYGED